MSVPAIDIDGLTKFYGDVRGVEDVSLAVERGEVFGFLGPNGAGKSTAIRALLGLLKPTEGSAYLLGAPVTDRAALRSAKHHVGHVPGDVRFYDGLTGRRVLDYFERLRGGERRAELSERFPAPFDRPIRTYSKGNRQKLALVQAFMHDPAVVVMDEPTAGLDPLVQETFYDFLDAECERGTTVLLSSHVLSEVRRVCDRVAIIRNGRLVAVESVAELLAERGTVVHARLRESPPLDAFDVPGVTAREYADDGSLRLVVGTEFDPLIEALAAYTVEDLDVREASIEDVFLHFYTDVEEATAGDAAERTHAADDGDDALGGAHGGGDV